MAIVYRTDGAWGTGLGSDLTPAQVDGNFWQLVQDVAAKAVQGVGISNFSVSGGQMTVVLTDHTLLGPYPLPLAELNFRGEWAPDTDYFANDIITEGGSTYMVLANHHSDMTFDPGANNGSGQDYYGLLLSNPALHIAAGGTEGMVYTKSSSTDYDAHWLFQTLAGLHDVLESPAPVSGDLVYWTGSHFSYIDPATVTADATFAGLADVTITTPLSGQPIIWSGTKFINTNKVDLPWATVTTFGGSVTVDRANGEVQTLSVNGAATLSFAGFPVTGRMGRLVLRVINSGHLLSWPGSLKWPGGTPAVESDAGTNIYIFLSFDGGAVVYANLVGSGYA